MTGTVRHRPKIICNGLVFRPYNSLYKTKGGYEQRLGFRLLKRKSCKGCIKCGYAYECLDDIISCDDQLYIDGDIDVFSLYTVRFGDDGEEVEFVQLPKGKYD